MNGLLQIANEENIKIDFFPMKKVKALSIPRSIAINPNKINTNRELKEALAHELGHHMRNAFYTIHSSLETKKRQEERATRWAVQTLVLAEEIKKAFKKGYVELWQLADYFDVSEEFMADAIRVHRLKGKI